MRTEARGCVQQLTALEFSFDLLPAAEMPDGPQAFFLPLDGGARRLLAASASPLQRDDIRSQDARYHDLVRAAKHWRDEKRLWADGSLPPSYLIECVMSHAFQQSNAADPAAAAPAAAAAKSKQADRSDVMFCLFL